LQSSLHLSAQPVVASQLGQFGTPRPLGRSALSGQRVIAHHGTASALAHPKCVFASISRLAPVVAVLDVVIELTLNRRSRPAQPTTDRTQRLIAPHTDLDLDSFTHRQPGPYSIDNRFAHTWFHPA